VTSADAGRRRRPRSPSLAAAAGRRLPGASDVHELGRLVASGVSAVAAFLPPIDTAVFADDGDTAWHARPIAALVVADRATTMIRAGRCARMPGRRSGRAVVGGGAGPAAPPGPDQRPHGRARSAPPRQDRARSRRGCLVVAPRSASITASWARSTISRSSGRTRCRAWSSSRCSAHSASTSSGRSAGSAPSSWRRAAATSTCSRSSAPSSGVVSGAVAS
jgi:hypothetical protein